MYPHTQMYEAEAFASQKQFRKMIKAKFDQHKDVTDLNELDMIL